MRRVYEEGFGEYFLVDFCVGLGCGLNILGEFA